MDLEFDARYDEFRAQVRDFVAKHRPPRAWGLSEAAITCSGWRPALIP